ncbi:aromatic ring-hydroxylating dioxygenase subunit alpha [Nocardioides terrisoli]|uniref:aromatic ring-hydroxylating dioxygenase subunit alpha n=1 Tax=Nocardioides terrisoli TaxID=3388267 RepID=UPI00287B9CD8|nr:aromatic ring-hydroxylating dioxygenase subunit alpha [Nocardioides marmorisolisilvae]
MSQYITETWYVAAWSEEITGKPISRTICGKPVVLFRSDGEAIALHDACAHRQYPLSAGTVIDGHLRCGYHGFEYGADGVCVRVPGQDVIPGNTHVRAYPVVERDGWVWIWPGDPDNADRESIPATTWLSDPEWDGVRFTNRYECSSGLLHDNLLDLTHEAFLHESSIGDEAVFTNGITVEVTAAAVVVDRFMPRCHPSDLYVTAMGVKPPVDRWHTTEFNLPNLHVIHCGVGQPGASRKDGYHLEVLNAITPESETSCHYFYANVRDFAIGDEQINGIMRASLEKVLEEDRFALEKQQAVLDAGNAGGPDRLIAQDAGVARARRMLRQMIEAENRERQ